jgi:hypothetical protein
MITRACSPMIFPRIGRRVMNGWGLPARPASVDGTVDDTGERGNNLIMHTSILDPDPDPFKRNTSASRGPQPWSASLFRFGHSLLSFEPTYLFTPPSSPLTLPPFWRSVIAEPHSPSPATTKLIVDVNVHTLSPTGTEVIPVTMHI